jgi:hypothetical protein
LRAQGDDVPERKEWLASLLGRCDNDDYLEFDKPSDSGTAVDKQVTGGQGWSTTHRTEPKEDHWGEKQIWQAQRSSTIEWFDKAEWEAIALVAMPGMAYTRNFG